MALRVTSYRPLVRCSDEQTTSPAPEACHTIVDRMPAQRPPPAQGKMTFGQPGDPDVQVGLPYRIVERTFTPLPSLVSAHQLPYLLLSLCWKNADG